MGMGLTAIGCCGCQGGDGCGIVYVEATGCYDADSLAFSAVDADGNPISGTVGSTGNTFEYELCPGQTATVTITSDTSYPSVTATPTPGAYYPWCSPRHIAFTVCWYGAYFNPATDACFPTGDNCDFVTPAGVTLGGNYSGSGTVPALCPCGTIQIPVPRVDGPGAWNATITAEGFATATVSFSVSDNPCAGGGSIVWDCSTGVGNFELCLGGGSDGGNADPSDVGRAPTGPNPFAGAS